jgi:hypothetical protein
MQMLLLVGYSKSQEGHINMFSYAPLGISPIFYKLTQMIPGGVGAFTILKIIGSLWNPEKE